MVRQRAVLAGAGAAASGASPMRQALDAQGLGGVRISASDETGYDLARTTWNSFDAATKNLVRQVNVHGCQGSGGRRDLLFNDTRGKILWNSETGDGNATAAYDPAARRLVIVAVNTGAAQIHTFNLSLFSTVSGGVTRWTTVPSGSDRYARRTDVSLSGRSVRLAMPAGSVQTLEIDGVVA